MDAIALLKKQHRKAETALKKLCRGYDRDVLEEVADELAAHMVIEETVFYPTVRDAAPDLVLESFEEHAVAQFELKRLLALDPDDERFEARATALLDLVKHHVEEEEDELFPRVEKALGEDALEALGDDLKLRFEDLKERGHSEVLPRAAATVTGDRQSKRLANESAHPNR